MSTMQHHHVILVPQSDKVAAARALLEQCGARVAEKRPANGPLSWSASFDAEKGCFYVDALFASDEAVKFHQANIQDLLAGFRPMMAAPPQTIIRPVFTIA
jgi:quinol monooxygenase YgiN